MLLYTKCAQKILGHAYLHVIKITPHLIAIVAIQGPSSTAKLHTSPQLIYIRERLYNYVTTTTTKLFAMTCDSDHLGGGGATP